MQGRGNKHHFNLTIHHCCSFTQSMLHYTLWQLHPEYAPLHIVAASPRVCSITHCGSSIVGVIVFSCYRRTFGLHAQLWAPLSMLLHTDGQSFSPSLHRWLPVGTAEPQPLSGLYVHPDAPNSGAFWMRHGVSFRKMKITNNRERPAGNVSCPCSL